MTTETFLGETTPTPKRPVKPLTSRLRKSKNFWKEDRMLDDYIDRTRLIGSGEKLLLKKMLKLRSREDSNVVKVTVTGLSKFLAVNVKTIRVWLRNLGQAGFIIPEGNVWDAHCNFPKKQFSFPQTFPGFDLATVFIRRGAKVKHKAKQQAKASAADEAVAGEGEERTNGQVDDSFSEEITCPVAPRLLDCLPPTGGETSNFSPDTNVSSEKITKRLAAEGSASAPRQSLRSDTRKKKTFLDVNPDLRCFLVSFLNSQKVKTSIRYVSRYLDSLVRHNQTFCTRRDLELFGDDLHSQLLEEWLPNYKRRPDVRQLLRNLDWFFEFQVSETCFQSTVRRGPGPYFRTWQEFVANTPYSAEFIAEFPTLVALTEPTNASSHVALVTSLDAPLSAAA